MNLRLRRWILGKMSRGFSSRRSCGLLRRSARAVAVLAQSATVLLATTGAYAEPVPLDRAIRLALGHSTTTAIADADVQRSIANYHELRNNFIPQLMVGSGLGWS